MRRSVKFVPWSDYLESRRLLSGSQPADDPLPDPESPPPPEVFDPNYHPPSGLPPSGPIGPGLVLHQTDDTSVPQTGHAYPIILQPIPNGPPTTLIA